MIRRATELLSVGCFLTALPVVPWSHAAEVSLHLTVTEKLDTSSIWTVESQTSSGDNDGIAGYSIDLVGAALAGQHRSPLSTSNGLPVKGFVMEFFDGSGQWFALMDPAALESLYYGVGSPDIGGRIADPIVNPALVHRQVPWPTPVLLLSGTAGDLQSVDFGAEADVNVWAPGDATLGQAHAEAATVTLTVSRVESADCNENGIADSLDLVGGTSLDCNTNSVPDECELGDGLSAHWRLDESAGTNALEDVAGFDGTLHDFDVGSAWINGIAGNALDCDGVDDHVTHPFNLPATGTLSHWLQPDQVRNMVAYYESDGTDSGAYNGFGHGAAVREIHSSVHLTTGEWRFIYQDGAAPHIVSGGTVQVGTWTHVVVTWDTGGDLVLYLGGQEVDRTTMAGATFDGRIPTYRTFGRVGSGQGDRHWDGQIDDIRVYDRVLPAEAIARLAAQLPLDCNGNSVPDACETDCNANGVPDACDLSSGTGEDCDNNDVLDACEADCNHNQVLDACDIANGVSSDCNSNSVPDECDIDSGTSADCNSNGESDECEVAAPSPDTPHTPNSGPSYDHESHPRVTSDGSGNWYMVWVSSSGWQETIHTIQFARSTDQGATWSTAVELYRFGLLYNFDLDFATDAAGNLVVVWLYRSGLGGPYTHERELFFSRSTDYGSTWSDAALLNGNAGSEGLSINWGSGVVTDGLGQWLVYWSSTDSLGGTIGTDNDLLVARSFDQGATWSYPAPLNANASLDSSSDWNAEVATDGAGNWAAVWESRNTLDGTIGEDYDVLVASSSDHGATWSAPAPLNAYAVSDSTDDEDPMVTTDRSGNWLAAWRSSYDLSGALGIDADILFARSRDQGRTWSWPAPLNANADVDDTFDSAATITTDGSGLWLAVWSTWGDLGGTIGGDLDLLFAHSLDQGRTWSWPAPLNVTAYTDRDDPDGDYVEDDGAAKVTTDGSGHWLAAWTLVKNNVLTDYYQYDVLLTQFTSIADCNANGVPDACDIAAGTSQDCGSNGFPDECESDCNDNLIPDRCDLTAGTSTDCNSNGVPDECEISAGSSEDCQPNGVPDECEIGLTTEGYVWDDGTAEEAWGSQGSFDMIVMNHFTMLEGAEIIDTLKIAWGDVPVGRAVTLYLWSDPDGDGDPADGEVLAAREVTITFPNTAFPVVPSFETYSLPATDVGTPGTSFFAGFLYRATEDDPQFSEYPCVLDIDTILEKSWWSLRLLTQWADPYDLATMGMHPLTEDFALGTLMIRVSGRPRNEDCNANGLPDDCDIQSEIAPDCNANGVPDSCDIAGTSATDCNTNGIPDACDIAAGSSSDANVNGVPDECTVRYVDDDAPYVGNGLGWERPFHRLQDALDAAEADSTIAEIRVAQGIYRPEKEDVPGNLRTRTFRLVNGCALKGGYHGCSGGVCAGDTPNEREIAAHETILSGDTCRNDVGLGDASENSYHVVTANGLDDTTVLEGFTITAGNADNATTNAFRRGGGIYTTFADPWIINCTLTNNHAASQGGGMYSSAGEERVIGCRFVENTAASGAGFYNATGAAVLVDCLFEQNTAGNGGGLYDQTGEIRIDDCIFLQNSATSQGGGCYLRDEYPLLTGCRFLGNSAALGGGVLKRYDDATLVNCIFSGNSANLGGGFYQADGASQLINCSIAHNTTTTTSGGVYASTSGFPVLTNTIVWENTPSDATQIRGPVTVQFSLVQGGWPGGEGNIDDDPLLVDPDGLDDTLGTLDDNVHLLPGSPCVNAGDPAFINTSGETDIDGEPRVRHCRVDMGVDETDGSGPDCDSNGQADACDIASGSSADANSNAVPDDCELVGACCVAGESCAILVEIACINAGGVFLGSGTACDPGSCVPPNDDCVNITPSSLGIGDELVFVGETTGATDDCPLGGPSPQVWVAFTTTVCADVTIAFCGTSPQFGAGLYLWEGCPCAAFLENSEYDYMSCSEDNNATVRWFALSPGTYWYAVPAVEGSTGPYTITVEAAQSDVPMDLDIDCDVDLDDLDLFVHCMAGPSDLAPPPGCDPLVSQRADADQDGDVDLLDFAYFCTWFDG